ncbi:MAG: hypothetical protein R2856_23230 [Caldilineaceae bacterium]
MKYYDERIATIRKAMNYFWDLLADVPGLKAHRTPVDSDSNMAGWYAPHGIYQPDALGGLSVTRFAEAVRAEGSDCTPGVNKPLHLHPLLNIADVYGHDRPTRIAFSDRDLRQPPGSLPVSEQIGQLTYSIPGSSTTIRPSSSSTLTPSAKRLRTTRRCSPTIPVTRRRWAVGISINPGRVTLPQPSTKWRK